MSVAALTGAARGIAAVLIEQLRAALNARRIQEGFDCLDAHRQVIDQIGPGQPRSAALAGYVAQWVDAGYANVSLIKRLLARFPERGRAYLTVAEFAHLRMAEGIVHLNSEEPDRALAAFDVIVALAPSLEDQELVATAHFGRARCFRRKGEYGKAYQEVVLARDMANAQGNPGFAAVIATLESWIVFRKGKLRESATILEGAEAVLASGDDYVTLGNIESAFGRLAQHEDRYEQAMQRFTVSIEYYRKRDPEHQNLARSLANMAYVERLLSLKLKKRIDASAAHRRQPGLQAVGQSTIRERFDRLRKQAMQHLMQAGEIFEKRAQHHGAGTVRVNCGFLHFDAGEFEVSASMAAEAFQLGQDKGDNILMARARLLQSCVENGRLEEGIEGEDPEQHARAALECAREAIEYAKSTEHTRLLARAHLALGITYCNEYFNDTDSARACCDAAAALLKTEGFDPLWEDVRALRARISHTSGIDSTLRAWSQGEVAGKTLQQLTEEFAEFLIPKIWEQEQRKISRVATRLSVSPKKVRRILARAGLLRRE
jgi:tetratricopeptide (TPR) repeat protein